MVAAMLADLPARAGNGRTLAESSNLFKRKR